VRSGYRLGRDLGVKLRQLLVTAADLRVCRMLGERAAVLFTLAVKGQIFVAHGRLRYSMAAALSLLLALLPFPSRQRRSLYHTDCYDSESRENLRIVIDNSVAAAPP
jgi:hypothetical protein